MIRQVSSVFQRASRQTAYPFFCHTVRPFASSGKAGRISGGDANKVVPDDFFDDEVENEKQFLDLAVSLTRRKGLNNLHNLDREYTWDDLQKASRLEVYDEPAESAPSTADERLEKLKNLWNTELSEEDIKAEFIPPSADVDVVHTPRPKPGKDMRGDDDLRDAAMDALIARGGMVETRELNYSMQQDYMGDDRPPEELVRHMPNTAPEKFARDQQGKRHCPGGRQRRGKEKARLNCHLIDLDKVTPLDLHTLRRFLNIEGEILPKKLTGLCSKCQRKVAKTIKHTRCLGLLPHIGNIKLKDYSPDRQDEPFHVPATGEYHESKTVW